MKRIILIFAFLAFLTVLYAQTKEHKWAVGLHTNFTEYQGDLGNEFLTFKDVDPGVGLSLGYYVSPTFDFTAKITYFDVDYTDRYGTYGAGNGGYADKIGTPLGDWNFNGDMWASALNLKFKFNNGWLLPEHALVAPFAIGGIAFTLIHSDSNRDIHTGKTYSNMAFYYGGGVKFRLSDRWNMVMEAGIYNPMTDVYDGIDKGTVTWKGTDKSDDEFLQYSLGFTYNLGKRADTDKDGVYDKHDKCPNTPIGVAVDKDGCPFDIDADGIPDYLDKCPQQVGTINGCPDTDGDGIIDREDKCPHTPVGIQEDMSGCPFNTEAGRAQNRRTEIIVE